VHLDRVGQVAGDGVLQRLLAGAREAIGAGRYAAYAEQVLAGAAPWEAGA